MLAARSRHRAGCRGNVAAITHRSGRPRGRPRDPGSRHESGTDVPRGGSVMDRRRAPRRRGGTDVLLGALRMDLRGRDATGWALAVRRRSAGRGGRRRHRRGRRSARGQCGRIGLEHLRRGRRCRRSGCASRGGRRAGAGRTVRRRGGGSVGLLRGPCRGAVPALAGGSAARRSGRQLPGRVELQRPARRRSGGVGGVLLGGVRVAVRRSRLRQHDAAARLRRPSRGHRRSGHPCPSGWSAPAGFADAIGWLAPVGEAEQPHWHVSFTVADRDATVAAVERLGGTVLGRTDSDWTREALVRDPQGAVFTASQFTPPTS